MKQSANNLGTMLLDRKPNLLENEKLLLPA